MSSLPTITWLNIPFPPLQNHRRPPPPRHKQSMVCGPRKAQPAMTARPDRHRAASCPATITPVASRLQQARHPIGNHVPTAHVGLHQSVDHERRRYVDTVLAAISAVPFYLAVEIWDRERLSQLHAAVAFDPHDDVIGSGIKVRPAAMAIEFEFFTMPGNRRHDGLRCRLAAFERGGSQNAAHDHARVHVPWLRLKTDLDGDPVFTRLCEQVIEFPERLRRIRAGRFQEYLEHAGPVPPHKRISTPCNSLHMCFPVHLVPVRGEHLQRGRGAKAEATPDT